MMQLQEAIKLQKIWGKKPCDHNNLEKEYYLSSSTGDYVCTTCGKSFSDEEREERNNQKSTLKS